MAGRTHPVVTVDHHNTVGAWAKRYHLANRALLESELRPYDLGSTQWYVLYQLAHGGPTMQRAMGQTLHIERATLSEVVTTLVRKGLIGQVPDSIDQRQRVLRLTDAGAALWNELPDPIATIQTISTDGLDDGELRTTIRVLELATQRIADHLAAAAAAGERSRSGR